MFSIPIVVAFIAGIVSFLAPCVLPLLPGYLSYLAGGSISDPRTRRRDIFINSVFFVIGFSLLFAVLGVLLNTVLESVAYDVQIWLSRIGGALIIFFGLYLTGLLQIPFLAREYKPHMHGRFKSRYLTSLVFGMAFAAGWTPCVGAVLGSILGLAASQPGSAFALLMSYALGLGVPFLIVGLFAAQATTWLRSSMKWFQYVNAIFGVLLITLGILIFTQNLSRIANFEFLNTFLLH